jgi:universal stress protein E
MSQAGDTTAMPFLRRITVATDGSPGARAAVERAAQLAAQHGAALCLLQAFDPGTVATAGGSPSPADDPAVAARTTRLRQRLAESAHVLAQRIGVHVDSAVTVGTAHRVIEEHVKSHLPSLLVVASRFDPVTAGLGGTPLKLLRAPACPVLVVRMNDTTPYQQVLSAVDLRDGSVRAAVAALAMFPQAHHHLLYAVAPTLDSSLEAGGLDSAQVQALHASIHQHAERELLLLAHGLSTRSTHPVSAEVASDVPARALLVGCSMRQAQCVVVGHHDADTIGQSELGSMALHVLQFIPSDVLVVP